MVQNAKQHLLVLIFLLLVNACGKKKANEDTTEEEPPVLPASSTLQINADALKEGAATTELFLHQLVNQQTPDEFALVTGGSNHLVAYLAAVASTGVVGAMLAGPAAALNAALAQSPTQQPDGSWLWSYSFSYSGVTWDAALTGAKNSSAGADFSFAVTRTPQDSNGCCSDFVWLKGVGLTANEGTWVINDHTSPSTAQPLVSATWSYPSTTDRSIKVTLQKESSSQSDWVKGGFVSLSANGSVKTIVVDKDPATSASVVITWDQVTKAGSMINDDGVKSCWDTSLANATCP